MPLSARAVLTVDLNALRANWARLNQASGRAECAGVIKADAYGLGLGPIAKALTNEGCKTFFVATLDEGRAAREVQPGATVYVLDGLLPGAEPHYAGFDLRPVLGSLAEVRDWAAYSRARGRRLPAAIHIDTGINRLGMPDYEVDQLAAEPALLEAFDLTLVMSHLACADYARQPDQRAAARALRDPARQAAAGAGQPRQLGRPVPRARLSLRPRAARHRALRRTRARGQAQPDADGGAARRQDPAGARGDARRQPSATAPPSACRVPRASPPSRSAMPTASCAP